MSAKPVIIGLVFIATLLVTPCCTGPKKVNRLKWLEGAWVSNEGGHKQGFYFMADGTGLVFIDEHIMPMMWKNSGNLISIEYNHYEEGILAEETFVAKHDKARSEMIIDKQILDFPFTSMRRGDLTILVREE